MQQISHVGYRVPCIPVDEHNWVGGVV